MRSIWTDSPPHRHTSTSPKSIDRSPPVPPHRQQLQALSFPLQQRDDSHRLPPFPSTPLPNKEQDHYYPPALESDWPGSRYDANSFDQEIVKRRKLSLSPTKNHHQNHHQNQRPVNVSVTTRLPTTDTYYHQSRRKKRDTKPPNANDIRPFVEVEKTKDGNYVLPAEVDSWTVLSLGTVIWDKAAFHNQRYIYPVGYRVKK
jgi:hypothetical protein